MASATQGTLIKPIKETALTVNDQQHDSNLCEKWEMNYTYWLVGKTAGYRILQVWLPEFMLMSKHF